MAKDIELDNLAGNELLTDETGKKRESDKKNEAEVPETPDVLAFDYQVLKLLGEGSYGKTYLAKELQTEEIVAIKELKTVNDFKSLDLFRREAKVLESLSVAGIPRFYKSIIPENNILSSSCYIIQEYVKCPSIQMTLNEGRKFTEQETIEIIMGITAILNILQTAYVPAIIHRDIKPSNIMYERFEDRFKVYLIDFGAVANPQKRGGGSTIAGTLGYMAPEQHLGDCVIQSDFYSLGATALHMLTGVAPYNMESTGFELDYLSAIEENAPETSHPMRELLGWLMSSRYENRPSSAKVVMRALACVQKGMDPRKYSELAENAEALASVGGNDFVKGKMGGWNPSPGTNVDLNTWAKTVGTVWGMNYYGNDFSMIYEYTFVVNGRTWGGSIMTDCILHAEGKIPKKFPFRCMVLFDPADPRRNVIFVKTEPEETITEVVDSKGEYAPAWMNAMNLTSLHDVEDEWENLMTDDVDKLPNRPMPNLRNRKIW